MQCFEKDSPALLAKIATELICQDFKTIGSSRDFGEAIFATEDQARAFNPTGIIVVVKYKNPFDLDMRTNPFVEEDMLAIGASSTHEFIAIHPASTHGMKRES